MGISEIDAGRSDLVEQLPVPGDGIGEVDDVEDLTALVIAVVPCADIIGLGARFVLAPRPAMLGFGVAPDRLRAMTEAKGVRDITSGVLLLVVWAAAGREALGWFMVAVALTPVADALIVVTNGGKLSTALGVHGVTAALLLAGGLVLALG